MPSRSGDRRHRRKTREYVEDVLALSVREVVTARARGGHVSLGEVTWSHDGPARTAHDARARRQLPRATIEGTLWLAPSLRATAPSRALWLVPLAQPLGGLRWWLLCAQCGRWYGRLFLAAGAFLTCRTCQGIHYATQSARQSKRRRMRALKFARGVVPWWDVADAFPPRPRGMHRERYSRLRNAWASFGGAAIRHRRPFDGAAHPTAPRTRR